MTMLALRCPNDHRTEMYLHHQANLGCETRLCACGHTLAPALSVGFGLTYFGEGAQARTIANLGGVTITSPAQHARVMKERGVDLATDWGTSRRGTGWAKPPARPQAPLPLPAGS
jgi:hypothetical protein